MALLAAVANMLKARFSIRQIAAILGVSIAEAGPNSGTMATWERYQTVMFIYISMFHLMTHCKETTIQILSEKYLDG